MGDGLDRLRREMLGHWQPQHVHEGAVVRRMIVPGWPQIYGGRPLRGKVFLGAYLVLLAGGLLFAGTLFGGLLMGLAVSCHVSSILDVALTNIHGFAQRLWRSLIIFVAVILFVYVPLAWLVGQVASPQRIRMNALPFEAGDVLLVNRTTLRWFSPQAGDVVQYEIPRTTVTRRTHGGLNAQVVITGSHIDRILAVGGQQVDCRDGVFHVDGKPSGLRPLNPQWTSCLPELKVPEGQYLIVPSTNPYMTPNVTPSVIREIGLVSRSRLSGRVYFRTQPLTRFGFIH